MQDYLSGRLFWFLVRNWDLSFDILVFFQSIYLPEKLKKKWVIALESGVWVCGSRCGHLWLKTMATVSNNGSISPRCVHRVPIQSLTWLSVSPQWTVATTNWFPVNVTHSFHISSFLERKCKPQKWKFFWQKVDHVSQVPVRMCPIVEGSNHLKWIINQSMEILFR